MKVSIKQYFILFPALLCFGFLHLSGQEDSTYYQSKDKEFLYGEVEEFNEFIDDVLHVDNEINWDTTNMHIASKHFIKRSFDTLALNKYRKLNAFDYTEAQNNESAFSRWWKRILGKLFRNYNPDPEKPKSWFSFRNVIYALLIIGAIVLIVWFLLKNEFSSIIRKKDVTFQSNPGDLDITVTKDVLVSKLRESVENQDFRAAVRFQYLITLKKMNEHDTIKWKDYKLSTDYIKELKDTSLKSDFSKLTNYFNYSWYGNNKVNHSFFEKARTLSDSLQSKIN